MGFGVDDGVLVGSGVAENGTGVGVAAGRIGVGVNVGIPVWAGALVIVVQAALNARQKAKQPIRRTRSFIIALLLFQ